MKPFRGLLIIVLALALFGSFAPVSAADYSAGNNTAETDWRFQSPKPRPGNADLPQVSAPAQNAVSVVPIRSFWRWLETIWQLCHRNHIAG